MSKPSKTIRLMRRDIEGLLSGIRLKGGGDAYIGYCASGFGRDWGGRVKVGERLCTACFQKRGGLRIL